jgi:hypothetical protein
MRSDYSSLDTSSNSDSIMITSETKLNLFILTFQKNFFTDDEYQSDLDCYSEYDDSGSDLFGFGVNDDVHVPYFDCSDDKWIRTEFD